MPARGPGPLTEIGFQLILLLILLLPAGPGGLGLLGPRPAGRLHLPRSHLTGDCQEEVANRRASPGIWPRGLEGGSAWGRPGTPPDWPLRRLR